MVIARDDLGCESVVSEEIKITQCCELYLPVAFTPNNDGKNDKFGIINKGRHNIYKFMIANRWGQIIYEASTDAGGWDGTFKGVRAEVGTYYYYIKYSCVNGIFYEKKGDFVLIR